MGGMGGMGGGGYGGSGSSGDIANLELPHALDEEYDSTVEQRLSVRLAATQGSIKTDMAALRDTLGKRLDQTVRSLTHSVKRDREDVTFQVGQVREMLRAAERKANAQVEEMRAMKASIMAGDLGDSPSDRNGRSEWSRPRGDVKGKASSSDVQQGRVVSEVGQKGLGEKGEKGGQGGGRGKLRSRGGGGAEVEAEVTELRVGLARLKQLVVAMNERFMCELRVVASKGGGDHHVAMPALPDLPAVGGATAGEGGPGGGQAWGSPVPERRPSREGGSALAPITPIRLSNAGLSQSSTALPVLGGGGAGDGGGPASAGDWHPSASTGAPSLQGSSSVPLLRKGKSGRVAGGGVAGGGAAGGGARGRKGKREKKERKTKEIGPMDVFIPMSTPVKFELAEDVERPSSGPSGWSNEP